MSLAFAAFITVNGILWFASGFVLHAAMQARQNRRFLSTATSTMLLRHV